MCDNQENQTLATKLAELHKPIDGSLGFWKSVLSAIRDKEGPFTVYCNEDRQIWPCNTMVLAKPDLYAAKGE